MRLGELTGLEAHYDGRRVQVFMSGARVLVLAVLSRDPARLDDADARRFFTSLRVGD